MPIIVSLCVMMAYIVLGAILYMQLENWSLEDSTYFCFITLTTIGLGDLVPGQKYVFSQVFPNRKHVSFGNIALMIKSLHCFDFEILRCASC